MVKINDIMDDQLKELAYHRLTQQFGPEEAEKCDEINPPLIVCFTFANTEEGHEFWLGVYKGEITELPTGDQAEECAHCGVPNTSYKGFCSKTCYFYDCE